MRRGSRRRRRWRRRWFSCSERRAQRQNSLKFADLWSSPCDRERSQRSQRLQSGFQRLQFHLTLSARCENSLVLLVRRRFRTSHWAPRCPQFVLRRSECSRSHWNSLSSSFLRPIRSCSSLLTSVAFSVTFRSLLQNCFPTALQKRFAGFPNFHPERLLKQSRITSCKLSLL